MYKKYILITVISILLISGVIYSLVYVPQIRGFLNEIFSSRQSQDLFTNPNSELVSMPINLEATLPDLTIRSEDNFRKFKFGDLNVNVPNKFTLSEAGDRVLLELDENNTIQGFYYDLKSEPRKDIDTSLYESELLKNTYSLEKKSNISEEFVANMFNLMVGSKVEDDLGGEKITYQAIDYIFYNSLNLAGYFFDSENPSRYKIIVLSPNKLYIFNIKVLPENFRSIQKTFYNIEKVE